MQQPVSNSVFLRNSHFLLGDAPVNYMTSSREQFQDNSKSIQRNNIDPEYLKRMKGSQFTLGQSPNAYDTNYLDDYNNKFVLQSLQPQFNMKEFRDAQRREKYSLGHDRIARYQTETAERYKTPTLEQLNKIKLENYKNQDVHKSQIELGTQSEPWNTTSHEIYTPKKGERDRYDKKYFESKYKNFIPAKEDRDFMSENRKSYDQKPLIPNLPNNNIKENLRKGNLNFGDEVINYNTVSKRDYQDPRTNLNFYNLKNSATIDINKLRKSSFELGDKNTTDYLTVYKKSMTPKKNEGVYKLDPKIFESKIQLKASKEPIDYRSSYQMNYYEKKQDPNFILQNMDENNKIKNIIKNSNFVLGQNTGEYETTNNEYYKYNQQLAKEAREILFPEKYKNIRTSTYKFGDDNALETETTNRHDYVGHPLNMRIMLDKNLRSQSNVNIGCNKKKFEGNTTYLSHYVRKPLPRDEDYDYLFKK